VEIILAVILGLACGLLGYLPLHLARKLAGPLHSGRAFALGLICVGGSLLMLMAAVLACHELAPALLLPFGCAVATAFLLAVAILAVNYRREIDR